MTRKEKLLNQYSDWLLMRNFSNSTYKAYMGAVGLFWTYCKNQKKNEKFSKENAVENYLAYRLRVQKRDFSTVNCDYSALMWFWKYTLNREWNVRKLIRPKKEKRLPKVISPKQVSELIENAPSKKYRMMFLMYYSTGLRLSELRLLKWEQINFEEKTIHIIKGKGNKDRMIILHPDLESELLCYQKTLAANQYFLFSGKTIEKEVSPRAVQRAFINARRKAKLPEWVTAHTLRHTYATQVLKNGTDLLSLKQLLGHKRFKTTEIYLHLTKTHYQNLYNPLEHKDIQGQLKANTP